MKPTKNRYFCIAARRTKMLFESESQAGNFIKFNRESIEELGGKIPVRSYYCPLCMGWHVTSNPNVAFFENHPSRAETALNQIIAAQENRIANKPFSQGEIFNSQGLYDKACLFYLTFYHQVKSDTSKKELADKLLKKAFEAECKLVTRILEEGKRNDPIECSSAKRCMKLLRRASKPDAQNFSNYLETLTPVVQSFPNVPKCKGQKEEGLSVVELSDEEIRRKEEQKAKRQEEKLEKKFCNLKSQVSKVKANLIAGQKSESLSLIRKCMNDIRQFSGFPNYKERLINIIDELMILRNQYDDLFKEATV